MTEMEIRADERRQIAKHMKKIAGETLRDPSSDAIDGYSAAVIIELAETLEAFDPDSSSAPPVKEKP